MLVEFTVNGLVGGSTIWGMKVVSSILETFATGLELRGAVCAKDVHLGALEPWVEAEMLGVYGVIEGR